MYLLDTFILMINQLSVAVAIFFFFLSDIVSAVYVFLQNSHLDFIVVLKHALYGLNSEFNMYLHQISVMEVLRP